MFGQKHCNHCSHEFTPSQKNNTTVVNGGLFHKTYTSEEYCNNCLDALKERFAVFLKMPVVHSQGAIAPTDLARDAIIVWRFEDAPSLYREMSNNGGDEDWVVLIPPKVYEYCLPYWLENLDTCRDPQIYTISNGYLVLIASHS